MTVRSCRWRYVHGFCRIEILRDRGRSAYINRSTTNSSSRFPATTLTAREVRERLASSSPFVLCTVRPCSRRCSRGWRALKLLLIRQRHISLSHTGSIHECVQTLSVRLTAVHSSSWKTVAKETVVDIQSNLAIGAIPLQLTSDIDQLFGHRPLTAGELKLDTLSDAARSS